MALVFVLGVPGTGKTTVCDEFKRRGLLARDTDWDVFSGWREKATGQMVADSVAAHERDAAFYETYEWVIDLAKVLAFRAEADAADTIAFLFGSAANEAEVIPLASHVICLAVDNETLRHRLMTRTTNDYGKSEFELGLCLDANTTYAHAFAEAGFAIVDAAGNLDAVADEVLRISGTV